MTPSTVTVPAELFLGLVRVARAWQQLQQWEQAERQTGEPVLPDYLRARRLTSVEICAAPGCDAQVELVHPWPKWMVALLPDLSWVRCPTHRKGAA